MTRSDFSLEGRVAIVIGASRGIGRAIALGYARAGAQVAVASRSLPDLERVADEIRGLGKPPLSLQADISQKGDVDLLVEKTVERFGTIDILVNNPALTILVPLMELGEEGWDQIMNTSLKGFYFCCQAAGRVMMGKRRGVIINVASALGLRASPRMPGYSIAKAGVIMLTRVLAVELGGYNIRVNAIAPGLARTDFSQALWGDPEYRAKREAQIPLGRIAEADDMVGAAVFLASDASAYVNGHTLVVDGGSMA
ncbi:MAG: SDR family NAD(P)-dependent oxidoreductase [Dehalococcoidia bacterium]